MTGEELDENKVVRRKVQIVGGNTVVVSLPRTWADHNHLGREKGQNEEIEIRYLPNGSLMVSPVNGGTQKVNRVHDHKLEKDVNLNTIKRIILADFIGGIDAIRIKLDKPLSMSELNELHDFVDKRIIGFDMIDTETKLEVINMTQSIKFEVTRLMEILRVQSKKMLSHCFDWILDETVNKEEMIELMDRWEVSMDRQTNQMMRTLQLALLDFWIADHVKIPMAEILYWSTVTKSVESSADLAVAIAHTSAQIDISKTDRKVLEDLYKMGEKVTDLYSRSLKSFIKDDYLESYDVLEEQAEISIIIQKQLPTSIDQFNESFVLVLVYLDRISAQARKIAEASIDCEGAKTSALISSFFS